VASGHGRSTPGSENGRLWGGEAFLRPFLHWQCQLGTVPYTVQYITVITVNYGPLKSYYAVIYKITVRTVKSVPYCTPPQCTGLKKKQWGQEGSRHGLKPAPDES